jgi:acyl-CoA oxidase
MTKGSRWGRLLSKMVSVTSISSSTMLHPAMSWPIRGKCPWLCITRSWLTYGSPFGMNRLMFDPTIRLLGSETQKSHWLPLSEAGKIVGAYCSTELGHGSFVRGMETTATFDSLTDEFVIHSPTTSSIKFWPGAIGYSCTHAIVTARLIISSVDHGPHFFMVQFRSLVDGTPMPGIRLGDVGLKMSYVSPLLDYSPT